MKFEIDVDKIKSRQSELENELKNITGLLQMAEQFAKPITEPTQLPLPVPSPTKAAHAEVVKSRGFTAGLRRAVILALHTGPASERDVSRGLGWEFGRTHQVLSSMLKYRIAFLNEHGKMQLADEGKKQAIWYLENPDMLTYRPGARK